ncbi:hypothetical protein BDA99DRAFT_533610 [Phascolomyces articulosus]|uniref:Uncharacterized protein n=1 Tax=Phascolomyces articulosus TaxID=60185 RepID=A0AAD5KJA4_9FUNG|nr:hypothetical protein BDA99DRAFT_533610 [Phascolomyces articulosus]
MPKGKERNSRIWVRSRALKSDEKWCIDELTFETYVNHFKCSNKQKAHNRYMEITNLGERKAKDKSCQEDNDNTQSLLQIENYYMGSKLLRCLTVLLPVYIHIYTNKTDNLGLSSILDTVDTSENGQGGFFCDKWDEPDVVSDTITIIQEVCNDTSRADGSLEYLYNILTNPSLTQQERNLLRIVEKTIDIVKHDREYVAPNKNDKLTEQDYLANIWYPIFSHLFKSSDDNSKIRLKVMDSDLEALSHYPADGSFAALAFQPAAYTNYLNEGFPRTNFNYY